MVCILTNLENNKMIEEDDVVNIQDKKGILKENFNISGESILLNFT